MGPHRRPPASADRPTRPPLSPTPDRWSRASPTYTAPVLPCAICPGTSANGGPCGPGTAALNLDPPICLMSGGSLGFERGIGERAGEIGRASCRESVWLGGGEGGGEMQRRQE